MPQGCPIQFLAVVLPQRHETSASKLYCIEVLYKALEPPDAIALSLILRMHQYLPPILGHTLLACQDWWRSICCHV